MTGTLRFGMVGAGWMGDAIAGDFALCEGVELAALGARDADRGRAFAAEHGIPRVLSVEQLLAADDLDVIYIATTHDNHAELALAAIAAGKHVLVEKAFTPTLAEARSVVDAARDAGVFLMEAMWMRFNPSVRRVLSSIADGAIGEPRVVQAGFGFPVPRTGGRLWDPARAGGSLLDQGVYPLSLAQLVFGEPTSVAATARFEQGVDADLGMLLRYADDRQAVLASSIATMLPLRASIGGTEGMFELAEAFWSDTTATLRRPGAEPETVTMPQEGNGYVPMLRAVREAIEQGWAQHPLCTWEDSLVLMRTVERVRAAALG